MRLYVSDLGNWGIVNEEVFGFALVNCDDWEEEHFQQVDEASDSQKLIVALAMRRQIDDENQIGRASWDDVPDLLDRLMEIAKESDSVELHEIAVDLNEALGL
jgi:hypothetical protein